MAKIIQQKIFRWKDVEKSSEIERLQMVIEEMPDEELMSALEEERKGNRDDYPIRAVWNSIVAGIAELALGTGLAISQIEKNIP